jgi:hypothetical protein
MDLAANNKGQPGATGLAYDSTANGGNLTDSPRQATLFDLPGIGRPAGAEARADRDAALDRIARRADPAWLAQANEALLAAIDRAGKACVDDCRHAIPPPTLACWWCIVPRLLAARGIIQRVGSRPGQAKVTHGGDLRLWARMEVKP